MKDTHPITPSMCPQCGHAFSHAGTVDGSGTRPPEEGDFTVCIRCGAILQFDARGAVEPASPDEWAKLQFVQPEEAAGLLDYQQRVRRLAAVMGEHPSRGGRA